MKHGDNAIAPSYNAQISTEGKNKIIVGAHLSQCSSDAQSLMPALEEVAQNLGKKPRQVVVDGGFTNRENIIGCAAQNIDLVGSMRDPKERSAAAMKSLGIAAEFAPGAFRILDNGASSECPAGYRLEALRKNRKRRDLYQQYRARGKNCGLPLSNSMLPPEATTRPDGLDTAGRAGRCRGLSQEDGDGGVSGELPKTGCGGGVSKRLDQR